MIICFLQMQEPPVLPALHQMAQGKRPTTGDRRSEFADDLEKLRDFGEQNKQTIGELLFSFFRFYAHEFNYSDDAISIRLGTTIPKTAKWRRTVNNMLCVEEPFKPTRNLANSADDISHRGLHIEIRRAFDLISEAKLDECCEQYVFPVEEEIQRPLSAPWLGPAMPIRSSSRYIGRRGRTARSGQRLNSKSSARRASSYQTTTLDRPVYFPPGTQPWSFPLSQIPPETAAMRSALEALQFQEQQLRYQLYEHSQAYAQQQALKYVGDMGLAATSTDIIDPFYYNSYDMPVPNPPPWPDMTLPLSTPYIVQSGMESGNRWLQTTQTMNNQGNGLHSELDKVFTGGGDSPPKEQLGTPRDISFTPSHDRKEDVEGAPTSQANESPALQPLADEISHVDYSQDATSTSVDPSYDNTHHTISSLRTKSTELTLPSSETQSTNRSIKQNNDAPHVVTTLSQINEEDQAPQDYQYAKNAVDDSGETVCVASTISADSMQLTSAQRVNIVRRFSSMLSGRLAGSLFVDVTPTHSNFGFLRQLEGHLKDFSNTVRSQTSDRAKSLGCKSIRILRKEIARELEAILSSEAPVTEAARHLPYIASEAERFYSGQMTFSEKCHSWVNSEMQRREMFLSSTSTDAWEQRVNRVDIDTLTMAEQASLDAISVSDSAGTSSLDQPGLYPDFINDSNISAFLASHTAFDHLVSNIQRSIEKYHCNKMDLIEHHVLDVLRRGQDNGDDDPPSYLTANFFVDWDVRDFLNAQYPAGTDQDLGLSLVFVGHIIDAQLTIIEDYICRVWPKYTSVLLDPLMKRMRGLDCKFSPFQLCRYPRILTTRSFIGQPAHRWHRDHRSRRNHNKSLWLQGLHHRRGTTALLACCSV